MRVEKHACAVSKAVARHEGAAIRRYGNARARRGLAARRDEGGRRAAAFGTQAGAASIGSPMQAAGCIASARGGG
ncbi:hypothetical protein AQ899_02350 [Burkholderia pseudomallei]|nr:hypothetical protein D512_26083 [Burkholderia pseudomallei MSHR1043]OMZ43152.1 hypothetical protein AQ863_00965 [Burkholderia pseudomallei]OMZ44744.1 hypothetical protein AQ864_13135 [Burkholderia pseudomallei]OMZ58850.1 hypothetical protein AQ867_25115 [Burkholderia pseudomallei]OMZ65595.1 hypothetical protein AQ866_04025 [Burkholderia pseudomallei]